MSHDSHSAHQPEVNKKPTVPFRSSFWLIVILASLFIAAINFVSVMSHDDGGHGSEHDAAPSAEHHDANSHETEEHH